MTSSSSDRRIGETHDPISRSCGSIRRPASLAGKLPTANRTRRLSLNRRGPGSTTIVRFQGRALLNPPSPPILSVLNPIVRGASRMPWGQLKDAAILAHFPAMDHNRAFPPIPSSNTGPDNETASRVSVQESCQIRHQPPATPGFSQTPPNIGNSTCPVGSHGRRRTQTGHPPGEIFRHIRAWSLELWLFWNRIARDLQ